MALCPLLPILNRGIIEGSIQKHNPLYINLCFDAVISEGTLLHKIIKVWVVLFGAAIDWKQIEPKVVVVSS